LPVCEADAPPRRPIREDIRLYEAPNVARGHGEIWLTAPDGTNFAAPELIVHRIDEHQYLPPNEFIEAVQSGVPTPGVT
jgi:hypothetical protein